MRIAHVMETMEVGGAEVLVASLCRLQRETGHQPVVYCFYRLGALGEKLIGEGIPVRVIEARSRLDKARAAYRAFREDRLDAVHFHNAEATILGTLPARMAGPGRLISTRHGLVSPPYEWKREAQYAAASRLLDAVVAVCRKAEENIKGIPGIAAGRVTTVFNGCSPARREQHSGLFPAGSGWKIVQVGRLNPPKDPACLIEAAGLLREQIEGLSVVFVGDGRLRPQMEELVKQRGLGQTVSFAGERTDIGDWLDQADLFVLSSGSEGVPVSILEAMEAGLPVAASDVGGVGEVLPGGDLSWLVPPGDSKRLAEAILAAWRGRSQTEARRLAIRSHYESGFTLEQMESEYLRLYQG